MSASSLFTSYSVWGLVEMTAQVACSRPAVASAILIDTEGFCQAFLFILHLIRRSASIVLGQALTLLSEGGPNFVCRAQSLSLGIPRTFDADLRN